MGISYDARTKTISADPKLPANVASASLTGLPVFGRFADVTVENGSVSITYRDRDEA